MSLLLHSFHSIPLLTVKNNFYDVYTDYSIVHVEVAFNLLGLRSRYQITIVSYAKALFTIPKN